MLTIYRRHRIGCEHRSEGRKYRRCHCPIWVDGLLAGQEIRESLGLRDWEKAQKKILQWEAGGRQPPAEPSEPMTIQQACEKFLVDAEARNLRPPTLYKYDLLFRQAQQFAREKGLRYIHELDLERLREFRASWPNHNLSALKKLECLRAFCRFAHDSGWIRDNPARKIRNPKIEEHPTLPFTPEEVQRIIAACERYSDNYERTGQANAKRLRALVFLLRYSGLRIRDAVTLSRDRIVDDKLFLRTAKTQMVVYCPLPPLAVAALEMSCPANSAYYFWSGESKPKSAVGDWQRSLKKLFRLAKISGGHAHRFRDTFAVESLLAGIPLDRVSVLLGHSSVRITEKHYAPWVRARQEQLEEDVRRVWSIDPVLCGETKGTPKVHGESRLVN